MAEAIGQLLGLLLGAALWACVGAILIRLATRVVAGFVPSYGSAWQASFLGVTISAAASFAVGVVLAMLLFNVKVMMPVMGMVALLIQTWIYSDLLLYPEGGSIGRWRALLVGLLQIVFVLALCFAISFIGVCMAGKGWLH